MKGNKVDRLFFGEFKGFEERPRERIGSIMSRMPFYFDDGQIFLLAQSMVTTSGHARRVNICQQSPLDLVKVISTQEKSL